MKNVLRVSLLMALAFISFSFYSYAGLGEAINNLAQRCRETKSDAVLITRNGQVIFQYPDTCEGAPQDLLSLTPSIASLAFAILEEEGKLCIEQPVFDFYPEWNQGRKKEITIRHLLTFTSGLQGSPLQEICQYSNIIQLALSSDTSECAGRSFYYNPKALNLLSGIYKKQLK